MTVAPATAKHTATYEGETFYFCNPRCLERFRADPAKYTHTQPPVAEGAGRPDASHGHACCAHEGRVSSSAQVSHERKPRTGSIGAGAYVCPMHPEIRELRPGPCPKCGMALEATDAHAEDGYAGELDEMRRRARVAALLTFPLFVVGMAEMLPGNPLPHLLSRGVRSVTELVLSAPVVLWAGRPFFGRAWTALANRTANMFTLVSLGSGAAFAYSTVATVAPGLFPSTARDAHGEVAVYFEAAAVIVTLVLVGQVIELHARRETGDAIRALVGLTPKTARRVGPSGDEDVPLESLRVGDRVRLRPGERVPADGHVEEGGSTCDESMITGEPIPARKQIGDRVTGGTINGTGALVVAIDKTGEETLLAQIIRMVSDAQRTRAPIQDLADRVAEWLVPGVLAAAALAFAAWMAFGPEPRVAHALVSAVAVLVVACPCAVGLATPMSILVAVGRGARVGVLVKDAETLVRLANVTTVVLDKTGTVTEGRPEVVSVRAKAPFDENEVLRIAAALEARSEHPLGAAVVRAARSTWERTRVSAVEAVAGEGIVGTVDGRHAAVGNKKLLARVGVAAPSGLEDDDAREEGRTRVYVAVDGALAGVLGTADPVRPTSLEAIRALRAERLDVLLVTGDEAAAAHRVARAVGVTDVSAGVLPAEKAAIVDRLKRDGARVAMVGDGINDAPALAHADVGVAMGTGTDVAIESAGITLLGGDLRGLVRARRLAKATNQNIRENLALSFVYNVACIPVAAGALYPLLGLTFSPMIAAAAMSLSSASVIANALRLRSIRL
jgi:Cu+-exporting ATPase